MRFPWAISAGLKQGCRLDEPVKCPGAAFRLYVNCRSGQLGFLQPELEDTLAVPCDELNGLLFCLVILIDRGEGVKSWGRARAPASCWW